MELFTLHRIFNKNIFRIPDYQRGYSWEKKQLEELWQDILNIDTSKDRVHYTGLITVKRVEDAIAVWREDTPILKRGYTPFYVVDGQQRLTTIIILLTVLLEKAIELEDEKKGIFFLQKGADKEIQEVFLYEKTRGTHPVISYFFGYSVDDPSNEHLKTKIFGLASSKSHNESQNTVYTNNLSYAKDFFYSQVNSKINKAKKADQMKVVEDIYTSITNGLVFGYLDMQNQHNIDIHVTFETMNNRGKFLSKLELLKNRLIYLTTLLEIEDDKRNKLRKDINEAWKTIYTYLGRGKKTLDDDDFLKNHYILFFKGQNETDKFDSFLLEDYFVSTKITNKEAETTLDYESISKYVMSIQECVIPWFYMHYPDYASQNTLDENTKLLLVKLNRLGFANFKPLVLASLAKKHGFLLISDLLTNIELYIFGVYRFSRSKSNKGQNFSYELAENIYLENEDLQTAIDSIWDNYTSINIEKFAEFLYDSLKATNKAAKLGWYSWDTIQYFLFEYEEDIRNRESRGSRPKLLWEETTKDSIEHIFPQNPKEGEWKSFESRKEDVQKKLCNSLGNLLLISKSKNSGLGNKSFVEKRDKYKVGVYSENIVAKEIEWTPLSIYERGEDMIEFMCRRWRMRINDTDTRKLLLLDGIKIK